MRYLVKKCAAAVMTAALIVGAAGIDVHAAESRDDIFTEEEQAYIESCRPLKVGYVGDRKPLSFRGEDGELAGISRSIFDRISRISGLKFEYVELPEGSVTYDYLLKEGFDLITGVEYNEENHQAKGILMSNPYLSSRKVIVAKDTFTYTDDTHFTVAVSTGSQTIRKVFARQYPNFELVDYSTIQDCLNAVNRGEADLMIQNQYVAEYWLYKPIYNDLKVIPVMKLEDQLCFSAVTPLEKGEGGVWREKELQISIIDKSIEQMSDGEVAGYVIAATMDNMYQYTFSDFMYRYRYTVLLLVAALASIGILLYVNMLIRIRAVNDRADARAKGEFLSTMSHEIRTPLNGLISLNYLMSQNLDDRAKISKYLKQSSSMAKYLLSLVNNILDMSKLQENKMELEHSPVNLSVLLETVESIVKSGMEDKKIRFRMDVKLPWPGILGDEVRIQQIFVNVLDNARKYTESGGEVTVKVRQSENDRGEIVTRAEIADTGRGMSEEFQKKIFDPFTQERRTVSRGNDGTGLGMSICALLAESMGGSLSVESKLGEGSRFTFIFVSRPAAVEPTDGGDGPAKAGDGQEEGRGDLFKSRILIAEDNELNGQILAEVLSGAGFEVRHVMNGREAVEAFEASAPGEYGVILMDILMPELNGFEAAEAIRALERPDAGTVKIFACTANSFKEDYDRAMENGMDDFVTKPIKIEELLGKLKQSRH